MPSNFAPAKWGAARDTRSYALFMEGNTPVSEPIDLAEHGLTSFNQEVTDPVKIPIQIIRNGRRFVVNKTIRPAQVTELSATLLFPSTLWTPSLHKARQGDLCESTFWAVFECPPNPDEAHAYVYPDAVLDQPTFTGDLIVHSADAPTAVQEQSTMHVQEQYILWKAGLHLLAKNANPIFAVDFNPESCVNCINEPWVDVLAGGATSDFLVSGDRFANITSLTVGELPIPVGSVISDILSNGDVVIATYRNAASVATAATGGIAVSFDGGETFSVATGTANVPYNSVIRVGGEYIAVGGAGGGNAVVYRSRNGVTWTAATITGLPTTSALVSASEDKVNNVFYAVGEDGEALKFSYSSTSLVLTSLTTALAAGSALLSAVEVLGPDFVAVGGAGGFYAESFDGGETWETPFASASDVTAIDGTKDRTVIAAGTTVYERSVLTGMLFKEIVPENGYTITGNITDIEMGDPSDFNYFLISTDDGELLMLKPFYPNA